MTPADPTSLRFLTPQEGSPLAYAQRKFSAQNVGSFQWLLRKASRTPEYSRPYQAGDPLRLIDWRAFARTDHMIVREHHEEASATVLVVAVLADSMLWPDASVAALTSEAHATKWELAVRLGLHMAYNHVRAGDQVRFVVRDATAGGDEAMRAVPVRSPAQALQMYEHAMAHGFAATCLDDFLKPYGGATRPADVAYVAADGFASGLVWEAAAAAKACRFFHVLSELETADAWIDPRYAYVDEAGIRKEHLGEALAESHAYARKVEAWRQGLQAEAARRSVHYQLATPATPVVDFHRELTLEPQQGTP